MRLSLSLLCIVMLACPVNPASDATPFYQHDLCCLPVVLKNGNVRFLVNNVGIFEYDDTNLNKIVNARVDASIYGLGLYFGGAIIQQPVTLSPDERQMIFREKTDDKYDFILYDTTTHKKTNLSRKFIPVDGDEYIAPVTFRSLTKLHWFDANTLYGVDWISGIHKVLLNEGKIEPFVEEWKIANLKFLDENRLVYQVHQGTNAECLCFARVEDGTAPKNYEIYSMGDYCFSPNGAYMSDCLYPWGINGLVVYEVKNCTSSIVFDETYEYQKESVPANSGCWSSDSTLLAVQFADDYFHPEDGYHVKLYDMRNRAVCDLPGYRVISVNTPFSENSSNIVLARDKDIFIYNIPEKRFSRLLGFNADYNDHLWISDEEICVSVDNVLVSCNIATNHCQEILRVEEEYCIGHMSMSGKGIISFPIFKLEQFQEYKTGYIYDVIIKSSRNKMLSLSGSTMVE
jgi:hypothetical protein